MAAASQLSEGGLEPLFRWPGGKRWLVPHLVRLVPQSVATYHEPFFGGGALYFAARPPSALLSDANRELIETYRTIRDAPADVEDRLRDLPRHRDGYYVVRASRPAAPIDRAARFIYLTTMAFNGIYRVNRRGQFNVPFGGRAYRSLGAAGTLRPYAAALAGADLRSVDFEEALDRAGPGDFVYLDPPYTVAHGNNGFLRYNESIFLVGRTSSASRLSRAPWIERGVISLSRMPTTNQSVSSGLQVQLHASVPKVDDRRECVTSASNHRAPNYKCCIDPCSESRTSQV